MGYRELVQLAIKDVEGLVQPRRYVPGQGDGDGEGEGEGEG